VQRGLVRFFNTRGLAGMWHWVRVWAALIGTNIFWLGAWNLWELDCVLTPHTPQCVQHPTNHTAHQGHLPVGAWANYSHSRGFGRVSPPPFVGSDANVFNDRLPSWLGGSNTLAFRGEVRLLRCLCVRVCRGVGPEKKHPVKSVAAGFRRASLCATSAGAPDHPTTSHSTTRTLTAWAHGGSHAQVTMLIGFILVIASDSLYTNVGFDCGMFPWMHKNELKSTVVGRVLMMVRIFLGLIGGTMLWSGMYYVILYTPPLSHWTFCNIEGMCGHDMIIHGIVFFAGLVVVFATGTWSGNRPPPPFSFSPPSSTSFSRPTHFSDGRFCPLASPASPVGAHPLLPSKIRDSSPFSPSAGNASRRINGSGFILAPWLNVVSYCISFLCASQARRFCTTPRTPESPTLFNESFGCTMPRMSGT
jgi:hypothetical protein